MSKSHESDEGKRECKRCNKKLDLSHYDEKKKGSGVINTRCRSCRAEEKKKRAETRKKRAEEAIAEGMRYCPCCDYKLEVSGIKSVVLATQDEYLMEPKNRSRKTRVSQCSPCTETLSKG